MKIVNKLNNINKTYEINQLNLEKVAFRKFLKNSIIFISFALFNGLLPIFICLILSCIKPFGTQYTMAIGYITAIQLGFVQLSWSITIAIFYAFNKDSKSHKLKDNSEFFATFFMVTLLYASVATIIFFGSSYVYNYYASLHLNTLFGQEQAFYYLYLIWIYIFFNSFIYSFIIFIQLYKSWWLANLVLLSYMILLIGLCSLFTLVIKSNYAGLWCGFGISLSSLIYFGILCLYLRYKLKINFRFYKYYWQTINRVFKNSYRQLLIIVTIQIFKAIALICLGLIITDTIEGLVPISYQLSRVIWYNLLYVLPFLGYGIADAFLFYGFYEHDKFDVKHFNKTLVIIFSFVFIFEILLSIGVYYLIPKLAEVYLANNDPVEYLNQFDISSVQLAPLLNSLLKKESFVDILNSFSQQTIIDAIKQIDNKIPDSLIIPIANKLIDLRNELINPETRQAAIDSFVSLLSKNPELDLAIKRFFAFYLQNASVESVNEMFSIKNCNTYYFMVTWTTLYSCGLIFNNAKIILRKNAVTWWQALLIILVQAIIISSIVVMGITQQYSNALPMYDAWTMPLCVAGIIIFVYYLITYLIWYKKAIVLWNNNIQDIVE